MSEDFWENLNDQFEALSKEASEEGRDITEDDVYSILSGHRSPGMDMFIQGSTYDGDSSYMMREVLAQSTAGISLPVKSGTRVAFKTSAESLFTYKDCPAPEVEGCVVTVRTAFGDTNSHEGNVFVLWDDEKLRPIHRSHLDVASNTRTASSVRRVVANIGDLSDFFQAKTGGGADLIHRATKDIWALKKEGDEYVIERLFDDEGEPLKGI